MAQLPLPPAAGRLRRIGPPSWARYDPHDPSPREQTEGVAYFGGDWPVCLAEVFQAEVFQAEVFQADRTIHAGRRGPFITGVRPTRPLRLLDLRRGWPMVIGASHHLDTGRKDYCRAWARGLRQAWPEADGLASIGIDVGTVVTWFAPAADALGEAPPYDRPSPTSRTRTSWPRRRSRSATTSSGAAERRGCGRLLSRGTSACHARGAPWAGRSLRHTARRRRPV